MQTWLVTGADGFLGANLGLRLSDRVRLVGMSRRGRCPRQYAEGVPADLLDDASLAAAVARTRPDVVVHAAAMASLPECAADPKLARRLNADATRTLAAAAEQVGARFLYVSTDAVFSGTRGGYTESDPPDPSTPYGESKAQGEQHALAETDALVVRVNFFGWSPTGTRSILEFFVNALSEGRRVQGYEDVVVCSTYAPFLVDQLAGLLAAGATGIVHAVSRDPLSKLDFGRTVADVFGLDAALIAPAIGGPRDLSLSTARLESLIGAPAPTQHAGIVQARQDIRTVRTAISEGGAEGE